jgi:hypothetical protein
MVVLIIQHPGRCCIIHTNAKYRYLYPNNRNSPSSKTLLFFKAANVLVVPPATVIVLPLGAHIDPSTGAGTDTGIGDHFVPLPGSRTVRP